MPHPSNDDGAAVHDLDEHDQTNGLDADQDLDDDDEIDEPPIGDPFALAIGCDLLKAAPGVPGCWASMRCDCGRAFKIDLLTDGRKPCPGCGIVYSHCLLVGPADDPELVSAFLDSVHGDPADDQEDDQDDEAPHAHDEPIDTEGHTIDDEQRERAAYARHNAAED